MTSSIKQRILDALDAAETIELARSLVRIPSYTTDETAGARFLHDLFRREGLESELQEVDPGRFQAVARLRASRRGFRELMVPVSVPTDHPLVQTLRATVVAIIGREPTIGAVTPFSYAGNDTSHLYRAGIPCCLYGPAGGYDEGSADRWTSVEQIIACSVCGAMIAEICA